MLRQWFVLLLEIFSLWLLRPFDYYCFIPVRLPKPPSLTSSGELFDFVSLLVRSMKQQKHKSYFKTAACSLFPRLSYRAFFDMLSTVNIN